MIHTRLSAPPINRALRIVATGSYYFAMRSIGIKVLKNKLSEYVRLAAGGETILVTDHDRVVAELVPPRSGRAEWLGDAQLADAVRHGWLTPPVSTGGPLPRRVPTMPLAQILADLDEDRADR